MSKAKIVRNRDGLLVENASITRRLIKNYYVEKFFNKFLSKFKFTGLDYQQIAFMMRKFWGRGTVAAYKLPHSESELKTEGEIIFADYAPNGTYNIYDYPTGLTLINHRGVKFIPARVLTLDKEVCIGFIQKNRKSIALTIDVMIDKLVDIEMTIRTNLKAQKTPWLFGVSPENDKKMQELWDNLDDDDPKLFVSLEDLQNAKALVSGANYNLDKLEALRQQVENEILTRIGVNNVGIMQKKEHFTVDEVNANNEQIDTSSDEFLECLQDFFNNIKTYLGYTITVELNEPEMPEEGEEDNEDETFEN